MSQFHQNASLRRVYRRRRFFVFGVATIVLALVAYIAFALLRPLPTTAAELTPIEPISETAAPLTWPAYGSGAVGAVGFDGVLNDNGPQQSLPMASMTKTVTALVVLEKLPLAKGEAGPTFTLTVDDQRIYNEVIAEGGSAAPVVPGVVLTERQMLEALMLPSANNYSISLANWAYGSVDAFLTATADWLNRQGLSGTHLADSSGLSKDSVSTPGDLIAIGKLVLQHPVLSEIVSQTSVNIPVIGKVENTNKLLGTNGVIGLKTGTTRYAGACLLFAAEVPVGDETVTVVGVIMGAPNHKQLNEDVVKLIASVTPAFRTVQLVSAGDEFGSYTTPWGSSSTIVAEKGASVLVWQDATVTVESTADAVHSGAAGENVGTITFTVNDQKQTVPLELKSTVEEADVGWRLVNPSD